MAAEYNGNTPTLGVRGWLLLLALVTGLPTTIFSVFAMVEHVRAQEEKTNAELRRQVLALAQAIDADLSAKAAMLHALAAAQDVEHPDIGLLYRQARGVGSVQPDVLSLALVDVDGRQLFSTSAPLDALLPPTGDLKSVRQVLQEDRPVVSGMFEGSMTHRMVTALGVPVQAGRATRYALRMHIGVEEYARLLAEGHLPEGWAATLVDANGRIVARTLLPEQAVGKSISPRLQGLLASSEVMESGNREGTPVRFTIASVAQWGWHVVVQVPVATLHAAMRAYLFRLAGIGGVCIVVGFAGAWLLSRRFVAEVDLAARSCLLPDGGSSPARPTLVRELRMVGDELAAAREREEMALRDNLTGLAGRALFLRHAQVLLEASRHDPAVRMVVMFIDLDGFKQFNDSHGHTGGDTVLRRTARVLENAVRSSDVVGRMGGDEFVLCLALQADTACEVARGVAARIVSGVAQIGFGVGCSVGIALGQPGGGPDAADDGTGDVSHALSSPISTPLVTSSTVITDEGGGGEHADGGKKSLTAVLPGASAPLRTLLEEADRAMYVAKQTGKNSYHLREMSACD